MEQTNPYETPESDVSAAPAAITYDESKWYSPSGRLGRARYFIRSIGYYFLLLITVTILSGIMGAMSVSKEILPVVLAPFVIAYLIFILFLAIKRLHDLDWTGWFMLLMLVPIVNFIFGFVLLFKSGSESENKYGNPARPAKNALLLIVGSIAVIAIIGILAAVAIPAYQDYVNRAQAQLQSQ